MVAQNGQKVFGSGRFWGIPVSAAPTPTPFLVPQNMTLDFKRDIKRLYGQNQLPVDIASGMLSVVGKVTMGTLNGRLLNDLMLGTSLSTGQVNYIANESVSPSTTTGQITIANLATFSLDLGIFQTGTGVPLVEVASTAPAAGQYHVTSTGLYTVNITDSTSMKASYLYTLTGGQKISMANQNMGKIGAFQAVMGWLWGTEQATIQLNSCMASDYGLATVLDDYNKPSFGFEAATDTSDVLGTFSYAEVN